MATATNVGFSFASNSVSTSFSNRDWVVDWDVDFREVEFDLNQFENSIVFENYTVLPYLDEVSFDPLTSSVLVDVNFLWQSNSELEVPPQVVPVGGGMMLFASALVALVTGFVRKPGTE